MQSVYDQQWNGHQVSFHYISPMYFTLAHIIPGSISLKKKNYVFDYCLLPPNVITLKISSALVTDISAASQIAGINMYLLNG